METNSHTVYPVMEHFYTIQGEGAFTGQASYFIRLGGCDVGCHWCDVKESWPIDSHPKIQVDQLVHFATSSKSKITVITGGEPLMHDCFPLTNALRLSGLRTHIETSGAYEPTGIWDWFCLSPKKFKLPVDNSFKSADELKIIVYNKSDLQFAIEQSTYLKSITSKSPLLYLQPEWSKKDLVVNDIIDFVKSNPEWKISLQTHKYLNIP